MGNFLHVQGNPAGNEKSVRAVDGGNDRNPVLIMVLCYNVIEIDGSLIGFAAKMVFMVIVYGICIMV